MSAETTIARAAPGHVRVTVREGGPGAAGYLGFVIIIAAAIYALMPTARANPLPLLLVLAIALVWAVIARTAREEYLLDGTARSLIGAYTGAGTVVRKDVPAGALAINVAPQRNMTGWVGTNRPGTAAADAAAAAGESVTE